MASINAHWTDKQFDDFVYRISSDFVVQLEKKMEEEGTNQKQLANRLGVSVGRVSQVLNNPGNLTLKKCVQYARTLGMKVSVVAYEDGDPRNNTGPINSEIFAMCWKQSGMPKDFFAFSHINSAVQNMGPIRWVSKFSPADHSDTRDAFTVISYNFTSVKATTPTTAVTVEGVR